MNVFVALCLLITPCASVRSGEHDGNSSPDQATFRHVVPLNHVTFPGNVIKSRYVKNWIVLYCVPWFEQCAEMQPDFSNLASKVHQLRNGQFTMLSSNVRFAHVDCAQNKPLCNAMNIDTYPVVMHYQNQRQSRWSGGYGQTASSRQEKISLADWVEKSLDNPSVQEAVFGPIAAWQSLDGETKNFLGGLACVCVLVFSLTKLVDQFAQLAKLQAECAKKTHQMGSGPDNPAAAFLTVAPTVPVPAEAGSAQHGVERGPLIDLDTLLASAAPLPLPTAPASLEL